MKFHTPKEIAALLKLRPETIYDFIKAGRLRAARFGNRYRIEEDDLQAFIRRAQEGEFEEPGGEIEGAAEGEPDAAEE